MISKELLDILVCPKCKGDLEFKSEAADGNGELICHSCKLRYSILDGDIPNLLIDEALPLEDN